MKSPTPITRLAVNPLNDATDQRSAPQRSQYQSYNTNLDTQLSNSAGGPRVVDRKILLYEKAGVA